MADNLLFVAAGKKIIASSITSSDTTITLADLNSRDGTALTMADFGDIGFATIDPGGSSMELISFTGITSTALTGVTRGLGFEAPYTNVSALQKAHAAGTGLVFSNSPQFYNEFGGKDNDETVTGTWTFTSTAPPVYDTHPTFSADEELIDKKYADDLAIAGAPDASTTIKGIVEEATDAELAAGTAAGGTAARLFANGGSFNETAAAGKVPVAESTGKLGEDWIGLTTAGDIVQSDGTDLQRLAVTADQYLKGNAGGTAVEYGGANLDEANTFFGATDISGAEAETLTDGSNADALHVHDATNIYITFIEKYKFGSHTLPGGITTWAGADHGFGITETGTATVGVSDASYELIPGGSDGDDAVIRFDGIDDGTGTNLQFNDTTYLLFMTSLAITGNTNCKQSFGFNTSESAALDKGATTNGAWFTVDTAGALWACQAGGSTNENTQITGITLANNNTYRIEVDQAGDSTTYYVNGTLEATHTTAAAMPDGSTNLKAAIANTASGGAGTGNIYLHRAEFHVG